MKIPEKYYYTLKRVSAFITDLIIIFILWTLICGAQVFELLTIPYGVRLGFILPFYFIIYETISKGSTLGKKLLGIRIYSKYEHFERIFILIRSCLFWVIFYPASPLGLFPSTYSRLGILPFDNYVLSGVEIGHMALYSAFYFSLPVFILTSCILPNKSFGFLDYLCGTSFVKYDHSSENNLFLYYLKYYLLTLLSLLIISFIIKYEVPNYLSRRLTQSYDQIENTLYSEVIGASPRFQSVRYSSTRDYLYKSDRATFLGETALVVVSFGGPFPETLKDKIDVINRFYPNFSKILNNPEYVLYRFDRSYEAGFISIIKSQYTFVDVNSDRFTFGPKLSYSSFKQDEIFIPAYPPIYNDSVQVELKSKETGTVVLKERQKPRTKWMISLELKTVPN
ncbi:RDD family protein [Salinibacter sp.]|uniref:RDD family protein n=1 Tax=Salinibacter sp. TaxID=2065818 RepID=UPI0021E6DED5|nr:RDD family protein [Salinibacter sp.]